ncbi:MAG TPA: PfkB family carbohydrate kinase, partial [bacterium]|nr:PfkB family carbohydrate kinase [bacterium]
PFPALAVTAVDTTGAGDAFIGAFAALLVDHDDLIAATRFAVAAGGLACTRRGVLPALHGRADIFACGIVLWELVFARRLFEGGSDVEVLEKVRMLRSVPGDMRSLPPDLAGTMMLALAPDPDRRYRAASEMLCDLRRAAVATGGMATCYDLAGFLHERFSPGAHELFVPNADLETQAGNLTRPMGGIPSGPGGKKFAVALRAAGLAATLGLVAISPPSRESVAVAETGTTPAIAVEAAPVAARVRPPSALPERRGAVAIDTDPPGAGGILRIGDKVVRFRSPFAQNDIEIGDGVLGFAEVGAKGFRPARLEFKLDPLNPAFVRKVSLEREAHATLSVRARPWGIVDIEGAASGREAPVVASKLRAGSYAVTVTYPPTGEKASGRVIIREGASKRCVATFSARAELKCF